MLFLYLFVYKYVQTCLNHNSNIFFIKTVIIFLKYIQICYLKISSAAAVERGRVRGVPVGGGGAGEGAGGRVLVGGSGGGSRSSVLMNSKSSREIQKYS